MYVYVSRKASILKNKLNLLKTKFVSIQIPELLIKVCYLVPGL